MTTKRSPRTNPASTTSATTTLSSTLRPSSKRWLPLALLPAALFGCDAGPSDFAGQATTARTTGALEIAAAPLPPALQPAGVELFVQTPYEFQSGSFDLDDLEDINSEPVLGKRLAIPYDDLERMIRAKLDKLTAVPLKGTLKGPGKAHTYWTVTLAGDVTFPQRGQPRLTPWGSATNNGVHVDLGTRSSVATVRSIWRSFP
jgi:hypothetical protein